MTQPGLTGVAAFDKSEDRMLAVVARTFGAGGASVLRSRQVRVTHTLLFIAALIVSPGVCAACARGCLEQGSPCSASSPSTGISFAVAATRGHGSCCGTMDGPIQGSQGPGHRPHTTADAADGFLHSLMMVCGGESCDCLLAARDVTSAVTSASESFELEPFVASWAVLQRPTVAIAGPLELRGFPEKPASRPVRVLYGVWRN